MAFHTYLILSSVNAVVGNSVIWKDGTENAVPISQISGISQSRPKITENAVILEQIKNAGWEHELIFVNDGSADNSLSILEEIAHEDHDVKLISFSRNFGHEAAMIAGIDYSTGDGII